MAEANHLAFVDDIRDEEELRAILEEFYGWVVETLVAVGGPVLEAGELADRTLGNRARLLPPEGRLLLARDEAGRLVGCGALRRVRPDAAEMKHMYVRPVARGTGMGRRLFEDRIAEARRMGLRTLFADTIKGNRPMLGMYEKFGFDYIPRYPENANLEDYEPFLVYLRRDLD